MLKFDKKQRIILASQSPRRAELLHKIGVKFDIQTSKIEEDTSEFATPEDAAISLSRQKAEDVSHRVSEGLIIAADTIVVLGSEILGKPASKNEAKNMLRRLSGKTHQVITGFTILRMPDKKSISDYEKTGVIFRHLETEEIEYYIQFGNPFDKAGAYGIQDESATFAVGIKGCFYNVVGLPLTKFYLTLKENFLDGNS